MEGKGLSNLITCSEVMQCLVMSDRQKVGTQVWYLADTIQSFCWLVRSVLNNEHCWCCFVNAPVSSPGQALHGSTKRAFIRRSHRMSTSCLRCLVLHNINTQEDLPRLSHSEFAYQILEEAKGYKHDSYHTQHRDSPVPHTLFSLSLVS